MTFLKNVFKTIGHWLANGCKLTAAFLLAVLCWLPATVACFSSTGWAVITDKTADCAAWVERKLYALRAKVSGWMRSLWVSVWLPGLDDVLNQLDVAAAAATAAAG